MPDPNPDSILDSVKKALGFAPDYEAFDLDILMNINMVVGTFLQLGAISDASIYITDNSTLWSVLIPRPDVRNLAQALMWMKVRLAFDPPGTSFGIDAITKQVDQLEWRLNVQAESAYTPVIASGRWWILNGLSDFPAGAVLGDLGIDFSDCGVYANITIPADAGMWDLTGLDDFPSAALAGDLGFDSVTGAIYSNGRLTTQSYWWDLTGLDDFPDGALPGDFGFDTSTWAIYSNGTTTNVASWWDLTGLDDFPQQAVVNEIGFSSVTGEVWRKTA